MHSNSLKPLSILGWQALLTVVTALPVLLIFGLVAGYSALAGGIISVLANAFFALRLFSDRGSWQVDQLAVVAYRGVTGKLFITVALFLLAVVLIRPLSAVALFAVYLWIQISPAWIAGVMNRA